LTTLSTELQWALARERQPDAYRESLDVSQRAAARIQSVVTRLLALARAETQAAATRTPVRLDAILEDVLAALAPLAHRRQVALTADIRAATVVGDPARLTEAVTNIIANGVLYNVEGGQVAVAIEAGPATVTVSVTDTGIGIAPDDLPRIFDPFFRADAARTRDVNGAGLGLSVARAILEQTGGSVACGSTPGRGTTMTVRLPAAGAATPSSR
jgi:signal transduction histidine kinase